MTIYDRLQEDHRGVRQLLDRIEQSGEGAQKTREQLFGQLKKELEIHTMFEEEVFYPAISAANANATEGIDQAFEEHDEATSLLEDLAEIDKTSAGWTEKLQALAAALDQHIENEEGEIFRLGREALGEVREKEMQQQYEKAKREMLKSSA